LRFVPPVERPVAAGYAPEAPAARNCFSTTRVIDKLTLAKREGRAAARMKSLGRAKLQLCPPPFRWICDARPMSAPHLHYHRIYYVPFAWISTTKIKQKYRIERIS
jgi:hypothetical protein